MTFIIIVDMPWLQLLKIEFLSPFVHPSVRHSEQRSNHSWTFPIISDDGITSGLSTKINIIKLLLQYPSKLDFEVGFTTLYEFDHQKSDKYPETFSYIFLQKSNYFYLK